MAYVGAPDAPPGCIFCEALASADDASRHVLARGTHAFLILNAYPYASGHLMAVLNRHLASVEDARADELGDAMQLVQRATAALRVEYGAQGFNIGINQGAVAGAGIQDHLHVHVVPRWRGDVNFMPVVADAKVLPESLDRTWERLRRHLA
jgi:ATP adenylyltransferase